MEYTNVHIYLEMILKIICICVWAIFSLLPLFLQLYTCYLYLLLSKLNLLNMESQNF